jgi:hypothetical protein
MMKFGVLRDYRNFTLAVGLLSLTPPANAVSGWTDYANVAELTPTANGRFLFKLDVKDNPSGCRDKQVFYKDYYSIGSQQMYDLLLRALLNDMPVRVYVTGKCELNGYSEVSSVSLPAREVQPAP